MFAVTSAGMARIDREAQERFAVPGLLLMEQAGTKGFARIRELLDIRAEDQPNLLIIAGGGNNGGDALVIAREAHVQGFRHITILTVKPEGNSAYTTHLKICRALGLLIIGIDDPGMREALHSADFIFDGMIGTGLDGELKAGRVRDLIEEINSLSEPLKIALDIPSGLSDGAGREAVFFHADVTLTFGAAKLSFYLPHTRKQCGIITVVNPGFPPQLLEEFSEGEVVTDFSAYRPPTREVDSYKNRRGHAVLFAGGRGFTGAPILAGEAALRIGAGLVTLCIDADIYPSAAARVTSLMAKPVEEGSPICAAELSKTFTACAAGPGWRGPGHDLQLKEILSSGLPTVLDAEALDLFKAMREAGEVDPADFPETILTPHPGEFARLTGFSIKERPQELYRQLREAAERYGSIICYKSFLTYIVSPEGRLTIIEGMNPAMGTAGTGDLLTGIITGLLAQGCSAYEAAVTGAALHQRAGQLAAERMPGFISEDLLEFISSIG